LDALPKPLYWKLDLPEVRSVLGKAGILPVNFEIVENPHCTLLYLGGESDPEKLATKLGVTKEQVEGMKEALECMKDDVFDIKLTQIVVDESMAVGVLMLPSVLPCANKHPHVTLGMRPGVDPAYANELLQDAFGSPDERAGLTCIPLPTPRVLKGTLHLELTQPGHN